MKKIYENPVYEIEKTETNDIITASDIGFSGVDILDEDGKEEKAAQVVLNVRKLFGK